MIAVLFSTLGVGLTVIGFFVARFINRSDATESKIFDELRQFRAEFAIEVREIRERLVRMEADAAGLRAERTDFALVRRNAEKANEKCDRIFDLLDKFSITDDKRIQGVTHGGN
jgi:hypothetical protein